MLGLSQSVFTAFEVNGFVTVCVELLEGRLERDVSVFLETTEGSGVSSFNVHIIMCYKPWKRQRVLVLAPFFPTVQKLLMYP